MNSIDFVMSLFCFYFKSIEKMPFRFYSFSREFILRECFSPSKPFSTPSSLEDEDEFDGDPDLLFKSGFSFPTLSAEDTITA